MDVNEHVVDSFNFPICVVLMILGIFDFACNVYSGLHDKLMFKTINAEFGTRLTDMNYLLSVIASKITYPYLSNC
jgi:hypothetical protein